MDEHLAHQLITAAVAAPSSHNTQPWRFRLDGDVITVLADRSRRLPINDLDDRELHISCGTAALNLSLAARHHGLGGRIGVFPGDDPDSLATIDARPSHPVGEDEQRLHDVIPERRTTRAAFHDEPVGQALLDRLADIGTDAGIHAWVVPPGQRESIARLVTEGDRLQFADPAWRRELTAWMHPRRRGDGLVVPAVVGIATRAVVSKFDLGRSTGKTDATMVREAPALIVLSSDDDDPASWITTGVILERLLLHAAGHGLAAGYLNQPCQVAGLRPELQRLTPGERWPQVIVRLGRPLQALPPSPRRPVDDVLAVPVA